MLALRMKHQEEANRRRSERLHHELPVAYRTVGSFLSDWATNISRGGLFINTRKPLPVGSVVRLIVQLPGAEFPFDMTGTVKRTVPWEEGGKAAPGMAIEFTGLDGAKREQIELFVARLAKDLGAR
jgi:type IV pilus assembly protein PilZ